MAAHSSASRHIEKKKLGRAWYDTGTVGMGDSRAQVAGRKRAYPGSAQERGGTGVCWRSQRREVSPDASSDEESAWRAPGNLDDRGGSPTAPASASHARKRRHVAREIGGQLSGMTLGEGCSRSAPLSQDDSDTEMAGGNSYEIEPNRVYVHSLEDSDEEADEGGYERYELNPSVASELARMRWDKKESVPRWIATDGEKKLAGSGKDETGPSNALVLWHPPAWSQVEQGGAPSGEREPTNAPRDVASATDAMELE